MNEQVFQAMKATSERTTMGILTHFTCGCCGNTYDHTGYAGGIWADGAHHLVCKECDELSAKELPS